MIIVWAAARSVHRHDENYGNSTLMRRLYLTTFIGTGTNDDPFRPAVNVQKIRRIADFRKDRSQVTGKALYLCDTSDAEHAAAIAMPGVTYVPFEDSGGNRLGPDALISAIDATKRANIVGFLEAHCVPTDDITLSMTIAEALRVVVARGQLASFIRADDFDAAVMDSLVSSIPAARRNRIRTALQNAGFTVPTDTSLTVRQFLRQLLAQNGWPVVPKLT